MSRIEVWKDTVNKCKLVDNLAFCEPSQKFSDLANIHIERESVSNSNSSKAQILVWDMDTADAAMLLKSKGYNPLLLNMSDDQIPGGCVKSGSNAQEENLFRRSNYHKTLVEEFYPLNNTDIVYSPSVLFFKTNEKSGYEMMETPVALPVIACPAMRYPAIIHTPSMGKQGRQDILTFKYKKDQDMMLKKIEMIFKCAHHFGHDTLVLSAHGCGAWGGPTHHIAVLYKQMCEKYAPYFKYIIFAILNNPTLEGWSPRTGNFSIFSQIIGNCASN